MYKLRNFQFKDYLNRNANLITILGIFNGLLIYSSSLEGSTGKYLLGFIFTVISVLIIRELIIEAKEESNLEPPLITFTLGISLVWLFLVYLLFRDYMYAAHFLLAMIIAGLLFFTVIKILKFKFFKRIKKQYRKIYNFLRVIIFLSALVFSVYIWFQIFDFCISIFETPVQKKIVY